VSQQKYAAELEAFEKRHSTELGPSFKQRLQKMRAETMKAIARSKDEGDGTKTSVKKEKKKSDGGEPRKTAFDYYMQTMKHKYEDMEQEKRERKLRRRYDKLDDSERGVFEMLEQNQ